MNKSDKILIDPKMFAQTILAGNTMQPDETDKAYIKRQLRLYLEALLLVEDFNQLEETQFDIAKEEQRNKILQKIIERRY